MSLPDAASLEGFSLAELRDVVGRLVGEVRRLHSDNAVLQARVGAQQTVIAALRAENQVLRDEVARLKGLPPRLPSRPSGMEQATQPGAADTDEKRSKRPRGVKRDAQAITAERVLKAALRNSDARSGPHRKFPHGCCQWAIFDARARNRG